MELDYDPLWDESGDLRQGCTVREALTWLTTFGSHSAGECVYDQRWWLCGRGCSMAKPAGDCGQTHLPRVRRLLPSVEFQRVIPQAARFANHSKERDMLKIRNETPADYQIVEHLARRAFL